MQTPNDLSQRIINTFMATTNWLARWINKFAMWTYQGWVWLNNVNWPKLPLTPYQWIILFYGILAVLFMLATPPLEAGAELRHFALVEHIATTGNLPVQNAEEPAIWREIGSSAPLYYLGAGAIISPIDTSDFDSLLVFNQHRISSLEDLGNKNLLLRDSPFLPLQGTVLAIYLLRALNIVMGMGTIWLVLRIGRQIAPQRQITGYVAAAITAFNPAFLFISASVSNLPLVMLINAAVIYLGLQFTYTGFERRRSLMLAALLALAVVAHISGWVLVGVVFITAVWSARHRTDWRGFAEFAISSLVLIAIVAGWWYVRNLNLYSDLTGLNVASQLAGLRPVGTNIAQLLAEFQLFQMSFWGIFGILNIQGNLLFYALVNFAVLLALFGVLFLALQLISIRDFSYARRELYGLVFILAVVLFSLIAYVIWASQVSTYEGRVLFPFVGAIMPFIAVGFVEVVWWILFLLSPPERSFVRAGEAVTETTLREGTVWPVRILGLMTLTIPLYIIAPVYAPPAPQDVVDLEARRVYADYGNVELVGYDVSDRRYTTGDWVDVTLYWRVEEATDTDNMLSLALVSPDGLPVGKLDTIPGAGTLRTTTWEPGKIYADTYRIRVRPGQIDEGFPLRLHVNWWDPSEQMVLAPTNQQGDPLESVMLNAGVLIDVRAPQTPGFITLNDRLTEAQQVAMLTTPDPNSTPEPTPTVDEALLTPIEYDFNGDIRFVSFRVYNDTEEPQLYTLRILWESQSPPDDDYTAFAHVVSENGDLVAQADVHPEVPTNYWTYRDSHIVRYPLQLPEGLDPGEYEVHVGWYKVEDDGEEMVVERLRILDLLPEPTPIPEPDLEAEAEEIPAEPDDYIRLFNFVVAADGSITTPEIPPIPEAEEDEDATEEAGTGTPSVEEGTPDADATEASGEDADADPTAVPTEVPDILPTSEE
ncbi:MAG: hypothetical protein KC615_04170 [Anaerolineae bacterium]|nr:hypothetical protein [Anaerolineae bacterium]